MASNAPLALIRTDQDLPPHSSNVDEELGRVQAALNAVFTPGNSSNSEHWLQQRTLADRYLSRFQHQPIAWMVCDRLLQQPLDATTIDPIQQQQRRFFAAQTLHSKIQNDIADLPATSLPALRDSLFQVLLQATDEATRIRLSMGVAALAVQMNWTTIVKDLLQQSHSEPSTTTTSLAILRSLPEECASDRLLVPQESLRFDMRDHLVQTAPFMFQFLAAQIQSNPTRILQCFHIWIRYVPVHPYSLLETPLLQICLEQMKASQHMEWAADVIVEVVRMYPCHRLENASLAQYVLSHVAQLPLQDALLHTTNDDIQLNYCRVLTEMGESYMSWIVNEPQKQSTLNGTTHPSQLVEWILQCSSIPNSEISGITLHFWYRMVLDLEEMEPFDRRQDRIDHYTNYLLQLIQVCVQNLMRFPLEMDDMDEDVLDDLFRHRSYVSETIDDCCRLLGGDQVLRQVGRLLSEEVQSGTQQWQGIESCLSCLCALSRYVPNDEAEFLPPSFQLIQRLPANVVPLRRTACKLIGTYAQWLAAHSELLQPLLPYLTQSLSQVDTAASAAIAIKELCCFANHNFAIAEPVLNLYEELTATPGRIKLDDELQILEGVCRALSRTIQDTQNDGRQFLTRLAQPIGTRFASLVANSHSGAPQFLAEIDRLTAIAQHLKLPYRPPAPHPFVELVQSVWTMLDTATKRYPRDIRLCENICRFHKHSIRSCGAVAYAPLLGTLMSQLVQSFEQTKQSPFLYASSICITEYGSNASYTQQLFDMVSAMARVFYGFMSNLQQLSDHPDVVEELFYMMGRMLSHCPEPVVQSPLLESLAKCSITAMQVDHPGANKGTFKFLDSMFSFGLKLREDRQPHCQSALENVLTRYGQDLVTNLCRALMGDLPMYSNQIPEIFWKISQICPGLLGKWLTAAFSSSITAPERATVDFMSALDTGLARHDFQLAMRAFQTACERDRRFRRMQPRS